MQGDVNIDINANVTVVNNGNGTVVVNNTAIAKGSSAVFTAKVASVYHAPTTGDETNIVMLVSLVILSAAAFVMLKKKARFN